MEIAMSVYKLSGINKVPKRMRLWLIKDPNGVYLIRKRLIRKPVVIVWNDLKDRFEGRQFYFESCARFIRIRTEDKFLELIMSTRYKDELPMLAEIMDLKDFAPVSKEIKEAKSLKNRFRRRKVIADPV